MQVILDVDDVVALLRPEWYRRYNRDWEDNLTSERVTGWNLHEIVKPGCGLSIYSYLSDPDLYANVLPMPGAIAGVRKLRELGHDVLFATACTYGMVDQKAAWMIRWGFCESRPGRLPADFVVCDQKHRLTGDVIVEDRAETIWTWVVQTRRRAILVEYPHNRHLDLHSMDWQRVGRASAEPPSEATWETILKHIERWT